MKEIRKAYKEWCEHEGYTEKKGFIEYCTICAYMHDIGNVVNRAGHARSGALMAFHILEM